MSDIETHWRLMFPSDFVAAAEMKGKDVTLTIKSVSTDELAVEGSSTKKTKCVVEFQGTPKKFVLNKTNAKNIVKLFGKYTSEWLGKRITLYPTMCKFGKDDVECIRIRDRIPPSPKSKQDPTGDGPPPTEHAA